MVAPFNTGSPQVSEGRHPLEPFLADVRNGLPFLKGKLRSCATWHGSRLEGVGMLCLSVPRPWNSTPGEDGVGVKIHPPFLLGRHFPSATWDKVWEA